ncbi:potassium channel GORK-like [Salvia miltiorrhiza]|uniref:potassium channel GORK-like n=1 Tax=Salvia miltiorrhiza TaxID=226208 RepID=UPI0025AD9ACA|nr:potassium channel GORK-like [Salvia miltiorrhiza]
MPLDLDQATQKNRSFGFVTFLEREDAMDDIEFYGRILTVNYALPEKIKGVRRHLIREAGSSKRAEQREAMEAAEVSVLLLRNGGSVFARDRWGRTPLEETRVGVDHKLVQLLEDAKRRHQMSDFSG